MLNGFSFNVNTILLDEITEVDSNFKPCRSNQIDRHGFRQLQSMLYEIIDKMGEASAKAQDLHGPITTGGRNWNAPIINCGYHERCTRQRWLWIQ
ncbi:hypothetical protein Btru_069496 [Bulinus truncatus]|nr:hypothetical protein Btru_069496 [Bulinus truncatus]